MENSEMSMIKFSEIVLNFMCFVTSYFSQRHVWYTTQENYITLVALNLSHNKDSNFNILT